MIVDHRDSVFLEFGIVHFDRWHRTERTDGRAARIRKLDQFNSFLRFCSRPPPPWQSRKKKDRIPPFCAMNRLSIANNKLKFVSKGMQPPFHDVWCSHGMISYQGWAGGRRTVCKHARSLLTASFRNHWSKNITMLQQGGESEKKSRTGTETSAVFLVSLPSLSSLFALLFASWQVQLSFLLIDRYMTTLIVLIRANSVVAVKTSLNGKEKLSGITSLITLISTNFTILRAVREWSICLFTCLSWNHLQCTLPIYGLLVSHRGVYTKGERVRTSECVYAHTWLKRIAGKRTCLACVKYLV